jgi:hypothetical protein
MPVQISTQLRGAELVSQGLEDLRAEIPRVGAKGIYNAFVRARRRVVKPPPHRPGQTYVRTGTYETGWIIRRNPGKGNRSIPGYSLIGTAFQRGRDYTVHVAGDAYGNRQAWMHQGRWYPARDAIELEQSELDQEVQAELDMVARRVR